MPDFDRTGMDAQTRIRFLLEIHGYTSTEDKRHLAGQLRVSLTTLERIIVNQPDRYIHELAFQLNTTKDWILEGEPDLNIHCQCMSYLCKNMNENQHKMSLEHMKVVFKCSQ